MGGSTAVRLACISHSAQLPQVHHQEQVTDLFGPGDDVPDGHEHDVLHLQQPLLDGAARLRRADLLDERHLQTPGHTTIHRKAQDTVTLEASPNCFKGEWRARRTFSPSELNIPRISSCLSKSSFPIPSKHFLRCGCTRRGSFVSDRISSISSFDRKKNLSAERRTSSKRTSLTSGLQHPDSYLVLPTLSTLCSFVCRHTH